MTGLTTPILGSLAWIDVVMLVWFALTIPSVAYVAYDAYRHTPELTVLKWGWVLLTLYLGPLGLAIYVLSCKEPRPGTHEEFVKPMWKQAMGSTIHCVAGDATGIILAATVTALVGFPMGIDLVVEYAVGFGFGLLIFQALFMRNIMDGSYRAALRMSLLPEWLSMNMVMAGMVPVMVVGMMGHDMRAMQPTQPLYWGVMSLGVAVGFAVAYPVNWWLVADRDRYAAIRRSWYCRSPAAAASAGSRSTPRCPSSAPPVERPAPPRQPRGRRGSSCRRRTCPASSPHH